MKSITFEDAIEYTDAKNNGKYWMGRCPSHKDDNPSLSIFKTQDGFGLKCFAGCESKDIYQKLKDTFKTSQNASPSIKTYRKAINLPNNVLNAFDLDVLSNERKISEKISNWARLYSEGDRIVIPVFNFDQCIIDHRRYLPLARRTDAVPKMKADTGAKASLYPIPILKDLQEGGNLEHLDIVDKSFVLIVEGELDCLAAISSGILAITNTCGASVWTDEFSETIAKMNVPAAILLDNDEPGNKGALRRMSSLEAHGVETKIIKWPEGRPDKHDIIDEIGTYGKDSFLKIIENEKFEFTRFAIPLSEVKSEDIDWIFYPYIARRKLTILEGDPGIGKSFLSLHYCAALSNDGKKSLIISLEDGLPDTIKPRLEKFKSNLTLILAPKETTPLDEKGFESLENILKTESLTLMVLDTLTAVSAGKDNNSAKDMRPFLSRIVRLAEKYNLGVLVLRHLNKKVGIGDEYRGAGSIDITGIARSVIQLSKNESSNVVTVKHIKSNIGKKAEPFGFKIENDSFEILDTLPFDESKNQIEQAVDFIWESLEAGPVEAQLMGIRGRDLGFSNSTLTRAKKECGVRSKKESKDGRVYWNWVMP